MTPPNFYSNIFRGKNNGLLQLSQSKKKTVVFASPKKHILKGAKISHLGRGKSSSKVFWKGIYMLVPRRVSLLNLSVCNILQKKCNWGFGLRWGTKMCQAQSHQGKEKKREINNFGRGFPFSPHISTWSVCVFLCKLGLATHKAARWWNCWEWCSQAWLGCYPPQKQANKPVWTHTLPTKTRLICWHGQQGPMLGR